MGVGRSGSAPCRDGTGVGRGWQGFRETTHFVPMDNLGEVLELIHGAGESFRTVRASVRVWRDDERQMLAFERHHEEERGRGGGAATVVMFADSAASAGEGDVEGETSEQIRLWLDKPSRLREEVEGRFPRTMVTDGRTTWSYSPEMGALEHEHERDAGSGEAGLLFDPARLLPGLDLQPVERIQFADRDAIRISAKPRRELSEAIFRLGPGADEYELVVDAERGILLRTAAYLEGEPFSTTDVTEIAFDEALDPEIFQFQPPEGEEIRRPEEVFPHPEDVTIEEAAARASFPVWIPNRLPGGGLLRHVRGGWEINVMYMPASERPPIPESVYVHYWSDAGGSIEINERKSEGRIDAQPPWEEVEVEGERYLVREPPRRKIPVPTTVRLEREGTEIEISSPELGRDKLLELGRSLVRAPAEPPAFSP